MALSIQLLGNGQLPAATGDLYTVPAATQTIIKTITLVNTNTTTETVNLYVLPSGGTARKIVPVNLQLPSGYQYKTEPGEVYTLETGDKIRGDTTTAAKVDYVINGVENA